MPVLFTATRCFGPADGDAWQTYLAWLRAPQVVELVSLDALLCPTLFDDLLPEDWHHNVQEDGRAHLFRAPDHVLARVGERRANVLAVAENPREAELEAFADPRFRRCGLDLVERGIGNISALTNCRGFEKAFDPQELNELGLLSDLWRAREVQARLLDEYPGEPHANCDLVAIWRFSQPTLAPA